MLYPIIPNARTLRFFLILCLHITILAIVYICPATIYIHVASPRDISSVFHVANSIIHHALVYKILCSSMRELYVHLIPEACIVAILLFNKNTRVLQILFHVHLYLIGI